MAISDRISANTVLPHGTNQIVEIDLTAEEITQGAASASTVGAAVAALHRDGIVVLNSAVPVEEIDTLNRVLKDRIPTLLNDPKLHFNGGQKTGNIAQSPPLQPDLMFPKIWANPYALEVIAAVIGPQPHCNYVLGNTAISGASERQDVHADLNFNYPSMPFALVANYYLCDTDESNGATEVWPCSHTWSHFDLHQQGQAWIKPEHLQEAQEAGFKPLRPSVKRGSVVIRDLRLWHAGIPNPSMEPRIMLAFVHFPWWYQNFKRVVLPASCRPFIESIRDRVVYDVDYVDGEVDSTKVNFQAYFASENSAYNSLILPRKNVGKNPYVKADGSVQAGADSIRIKAGKDEHTANETVLAYGSAGTAT